ncbi:unnamed protein product, partial [Brenthis ino]
MNGEEWLQNRRIANKHLLRDDAERLIRSAIVESVEKFILQLKAECSKESQVKDMESKLYKLSTSVIIGVLLGKNTLKNSRHHEELLQIFAASVKKIFQVTTKLYVWPVDWCQRLNLKVWRDFKECVDLSLLLANKMASEMIRNGDKSDGLINKLVGENIKNEDIVRIIADFIIAAGDTTAYTTLWILLLLCKNKNVVYDIRSKEDDYVKFVVKEGMRLYPVAPFLTRILPENTFLGKYEVNKQTPIIASIYTTGRDEQYFSHAQSFLPYRWDRNDSRKAKLANHVPSASLPFAMGARSCVGKKIAMIQLIEVISQIVKNFNFQCNNKENINSITSQVLIPDKCIEFSFTVRNKIDHLSI